MRTVLPLVDMRRYRTTYIVVGLALLALIGTSFFLIPKKPLCPDCNVVLITIDSMDRDHLGLYGSTRDTSPNLTTWAKDAFVFDQYIATSGLTPTTQMSIQTGLYPSNSGIVSFSSRLPDSVPTLAELLKKSGYATAAIGSAPEYFADRTTGWHARRDSFSRGFDQYFEDYFEYALTPHSSPARITTWQDFRSPQIERGLPMNAIDWLSAAPAQKFFLWIPIGTVHWPYNDEKPLHFADPTYRGVLRYDQITWKLPSQFQRLYKDRLWPKSGTPVPLSKNDTQFIIDRYDDGIYLTDEFLGKLFQTLKEKGLDRNTIVIITTEHGEEFGEHGYYAHYDVFDPEVRVPLLIKFPANVGRRIGAQVSSVDILPTLLEAIGLPLPKKVDGMSFVSLLRAGARDVSEFRRYAFTERTPLMETLMYNPADKKEDWLVPFLIADGKEHYRDVAVRTKNWKLIFRESAAVEEKYSWWQWISGEKAHISQYELYNLSEDPLEQKNVIDTHPEVAAELKGVLIPWASATTNERKKIPETNYAF